MYDVIIIGMGISGITAGIYAKRKNKKVLLLDKGMPGGLLNNIDKISNYPGLIDIKGPEFAQILEKQVQSLNIETRYEEVKSVMLDKSVKEVVTSLGTYKAKKIILAMGRKPKYLGLDNEKDLLGRGLSTCAMCDAYFYKDLPVAVVGAGNSALQEALYLQNIASKVYLIDRKNIFKADEELVEKVKKSSKINIIYNANVKKINEEDGKILSITLDNAETINVSGVFIYIGYQPDTAILPKEILDENNYVKVNSCLETPLKDVYAIGDIIKKDTYQLVTAAADGARVINNMKS